MDRRRQPGRRMRLFAIVAAILGAGTAGAVKLLVGGAGTVPYSDSDLRRLRVA